jgi:transposase InsO family protein
MDQRLRFVTECRSELFTMTELVDQDGISRKTGYKWLDRYEADGVAGLTDRSRRPHQSPHATDPDVVEALLTLRTRHPRWGAKKLLAVLARRHRTLPRPGRSTVCDLLTRAGVVRPRPRPRHGGHAPSPVVAPTHPNQTWTVDFKGEFRTGDGRLCYPLTLRDGWSRFVWRCDALIGPTYDATRDRVERAFAEYGLPDRIRSDNGSPFAGIGLGRLSRVAVWWMRLGIVPERITPGHPEQNGSHEQFHAVLKAETARPPAPNARAQQSRFRRFRAEYHHERPHEALHDQPPATCYTPSRRSLPSTLPPTEYPGHLERRRVSTVGCISWRNRPVFLSEALAGETVAFEEIDDGLWTVYVASIALARFDERRGRVDPIAGDTAGRSPTTSARASLKP